MKTTKQYTDLQTVDEFIYYYTGASKSELKARLKSLGGRSKHLDRTKSNEREAIIALLA